MKDDATLESLDVKDGGALFFKDLGPQIGWRTVHSFIELEYCSIVGITFSLTLAQIGSSYILPYFY